MTKKWKDKTRDGTPVRIYAQDGGREAQRIHGALNKGDGWSMRFWDSNGGYSDGCKNGLDLLPAEPERIVIENVEFEPSSINLACAILRGKQYAQLVGKRGRLEFVVEDET